MDFDNIDLTALMAKYARACKRLEKLHLEIEKMRIYIKENV